MRSQMLKSLLLLGAGLFAASPMRADLVLNAAGIADGFTASNFVTGLASTGSTFGQGPFGMTVVSNGSGGFNVLVGNFANSTLSIYNDANGQLLTTVTGFQPFAEGFATLNGVAYGGNGSKYGSFDPNTGAFSPLNITNLPAPYLGMAADSATNELIAFSQNGLIAINPTTNSFRTINNATGIDGVSVSPDGQTVYVEQNGNILGYNVNSGALTFTAPTPAGAYLPDGTGVITSNNSLNGDIIVNDNLGNVYLIDPTSNSITLIGTNSNERGDFTAPDFTNGTLLMDFSDQIERLSCGQGCVIGSTGGNSVPEASSFQLAGLALAGLVGFSRRLLRKS
ncbi:MAG TPA: hypothetical protein VKT49_04910 [Bryobacteraceae bacterium]|nr:hypothetical protein [Bryobacteraceae bacterium]